MQPLIEKVVNGIAPAVQLRRILMQHYKIIDITQVMLDLELVFAKLVQLVEVDVAEKLAGEAANRQSDLLFGMKQALVGRNHL